MLPYIVLSMLMISLCSVYPHMQLIVLFMVFAMNFLLSIWVHFNIFLSWWLLIDRPQGLNLTRHKYDFHISCCVGMLKCRSVDTPMSPIIKCSVLIVILLGWMMLLPTRVLLVVRSTLRLLALICYLLIICLSVPSIVH